MKSRRTKRHDAQMILGAVCAIAITFMVGCRAVVGPRARATTASKFESTPARLARGKYLAENVSACMECHTPHDSAARESPLTPRKVGSGEVMPITSLPGRIVAPNLTPDPETGAGNWTDDQLARAIREGIGHDGRALFPAMPYRSFRALSDEDVASIVVYLRALPPVRNPLPKRKLSVGARIVIAGMPAPLRISVPRPDLSTPEARGRYLVEVAGCADCHTPSDKFGRSLPRLELGGGFVLTGPFGSVASANITPDPSGISYYDAAMFTKAMRTGFVGARPLNPVMPWTTYAGMTDEGLADIFAYLRTLPPVHHTVDNTEPPTFCRICKKVHGGGSMN